MSVHTQTHSEEETIALAGALARSLRGGDVVTLDGPLGSGKTCFVRGLAAGLGLDPAEVSSPTFLICHEYTGSQPPHLVHVDAYRLAAAADLATIGWEEILARKDVIIALEWPGRVREALPEALIAIRLEHLGPASRGVRIEARPGVEERLRSIMTGPAGGRCAICGKPVATAADTFPFCSARCRLIDLGRWASDSYRISDPLSAADDPVGE